MSNIKSMVERQIALAEMFLYENEIYGLYTGASILLMQSLKNLNIRSELRFGFLVVNETSATRHVWLSVPDAGIDVIDVACITQIRYIPELARLKYDYIVSDTVPPNTFRLDNETEDEIKELEQLNQDIERLRKSQDVVNEYLCMVPKQTRELHECALLWMADRS
jgi:hypothetical protein